jgi:hypothetical protein
MAQKSLRFGITDGESLRSATWKLWTETSGGNSEVYLACRSLGGELKASMHQSGNWHVAFSNSTYKNKVEGAIPSLDSRFAEKWPKPLEIANGITLAFRIVTPSSSITTSRETGKYKGVIWLPNSPENKAIEVYILIVEEHVPVSGWPGKNSMKTDLIGSFPLNNGGTVWAVYSVIDMPELSNSVKGIAHFFKGKTKEDLASSDNLRALVFGSEKDGSRTIYDLVAQHKSG